MVQHELPQSFDEPGVHGSAQTQRGCEGFGLDIPNAGETVLEHQLGQTFDLVLGNEAGDESRESRQSATRVQKVVDDPDNNKTCSKSLNP
jgi:hypothetical protein